MSNATQNCEFCGSPAHIWFNCTKRPTDWKPERLRKKSTAKPITSRPVAQVVEQAERAGDAATKHKVAGSSPAKSIRKGASTKSTAAHRAKSGDGPPSESLDDLGPVVAVDRRDIQSGTAAADYEVTGERGSGMKPPAASTLEKAEAAAAHLAPKRGRPRVHPDRKAYKAEKERERRAKQKAEKEGKE